MCEAHKGLYVRYIRTHHYINELSSACDHAADMLLISINLFSTLDMAVQRNVPRFCTVQSVAETFSFKLYFRHDVAVPEPVMLTILAHLTLTLSS